MNPWDLSASDLLVWGIVLHLIADWPLQNDWIANNKALRRMKRRKRLVNHLAMDADAYQKVPVTSWWDRHPAAYVHAGIHGILLALIFGWVALPLAVVHLLIDTRTPVMWWSRLVRQTQPQGNVVETGFDERRGKMGYATLYDIGTEVRFWVDQVFHIACIAVAALLVA